MLKCKDNTVSVIQYSFKGEKTKERRLNDKNNENIISGETFSKMI